MKKKELKSCLDNNNQNYESLKNPDYYDFEVQGMPQEFEGDREKLKQYCAQKGSVNFNFLL